MKKGSYGRSKLIGQSPIQRKWSFKATTINFIDISYIAIFYINSDDSNIATVNDIGSPIISLKLNQLRLDTYDITKIIQTYGSGCYFFAWVNTSGQIQDNQLIDTIQSEESDIDNEECLVFTPSLTISWKNGSLINSINSIRGVYIKNPSLPINSNNTSHPNNLILLNSNVSK